MASNSSAVPRQNNEIVRTDGQSSPPDQKGVAAKYAQHFIQDGPAYRSAQFPDKIEFIDRKDRMQVYGKVAVFTVRAMMETAKERGWQSLDVRGNNAFFKSMAYVEGMSAGIKVTGHQPSQKDKEALQRRETREAARANPMVQAFIGAKTTKDRTAAVKLYPELKDAFAAQAAAQALVKKSGATTEAQTDLMARVSDRIARAVHEGKPMPQLEVRSQHQVHEIERD